MKGVRKMAKFIAIVVDDVNPETGDASEGLFPFLLRSYPNGEVIIADSYHEHYFTEEESVLEENTGL